MMTMSQRAERLAEIHGMMSKLVAECRTLLEGSGAIGDKSAESWIKVIDLAIHGNPDQLTMTETIHHLESDVMEETVNEEPATGETVNEEPATGETVNEEPVTAKRVREILGHLAIGESLFDRYISTFGYDEAGFDHVAKLMGQANGFGIPEKDHMWFINWATRTIVTAWARGKDQTTSHILELIGR